MWLQSAYSTLTNAPLALSPASVIPLAALLLMGAAQPAVSVEPAVPLAHENAVVMHVQGKPVTLADVETREIHELREQLYGAVLAEMQRRAVEALAESDPEFSVMPEERIGEAELRSFYNAQRLQRQGSFEDLAPHIHDYLQRQALLRHVASQYDRAVAKGLVVDKLPAPAEFLVRVPVESAYLRGNSRADVMFLEFSDFQCPFCARMQPVLNTLLEEYGPRVVFGYRHFPLSIHKEADEAAEASECAREQGRFDAYHALLFSNQSRQYVPDLKRYARMAEVPDMARFESCLDNGAFEDRVERDLKVGLAVGVSGTPTVIVGRYDHDTGTLRGEILSGVRSESAYRTLLEKYLALASN